MLYCRRLLCFTISPPPQPHVIPHPHLSFPPLSIHTAYAYTMLHPLPAHIPFPLLATLYVQDYSVLHLSPPPFPPYPHLTFPPLSILYCTCICYASPASPSLPSLTFATPLLYYSIQGYALSASQSTNFIHKLS